MLLALITAAVLSGSHLKNDLLDKNDSLAVTMENAGAVWDVNENGIWGSPAGGSWKRSLIVIGGGNFSTVPWFLGQGYTVWVRRKPCTVPKCCRESLGYTTYLADDSLPEKPRRPFTTFVHGHLESWHQHDRMANLLDDSIQCTLGTGRFSSVSWPYQKTIPIWIESKKFISRWKDSSLQKVLPAPDIWNSYLGAQFTITAELLDSHSHEVYKMMYDATRADETKDCEIDSYDFEFAWYWIFGEEPNVNPLSPSLYPAGKCTNTPKLITLWEPLPQWSSFGRKFHYNSEGIWSYPKCSGSCSRVMMVVGADPTLPSAQRLLETLLSAPETRDYGIWLRQPTHQCPYGGVNMVVIEGQPCAFTEGFTRFMHRYGVDDINAVPSKDRDLKADIFVFLSGLDEVSPWDVVEAAIGSSRRLGYYPVGYPESYCPAVIVHWPEPSGLNVSVQGFKTNNFAVPSKLIYEIDEQKISYVRELTSCLIVFKPEFFMAYWHFILGPTARLTRKTIRSSDPLFSLISCSSIDNRILELEIPRPENGENSYYYYYPAAEVTMVPHTFEPVMTYSPALSVPISKTSITHISTKTDENKSSSGFQLSGGVVAAGVVGLIFVGAINMFSFRRRKPSDDSDAGGRLLII